MESPLHRRRVITSHSECACNAASVAGKFFPSNISKLVHQRWLILLYMNLLATAFVPCTSKCHVPFSKFGFQRRSYELRNYFSNETSPSLSQSSPLTILGLASLTESRRGLLVLATVPLAWGTFEPVVRLVYQIQPRIPGLLFGTMYYFVAAGTLLSLAVRDSTRHNLSIENTTVGDEHIKVKHFLSDLQSILLQWPLKGGVELGTYLFIGNALQMLALETVSADRAAFLLQLTTIFVPLLQQTGFYVSATVTQTQTLQLSAKTAQTFSDTARHAKHSVVSVRTWFACMVALVGVGVMSLNKGNQVADFQDIAMRDLKLTSLCAPHFANDHETLQCAVLQWSSGDSLVVAAALLYTFHCLRLEDIAQHTSALKLATCKAITEFFWSAAAVSGFIAFNYVDKEHQFSSDSTSFVEKTAMQIASFVKSFPDLFALYPPSVWMSAIAAVLWTGWITVAYTIYAQSYGQSRINPITANLIYTCQPIWTAILAWLLLHEGLSVLGFFGGALIGMAVLLVVTEEPVNAVEEYR
jgi:drug/metabolite transporter (DMT)-like permease